MHFSRPFLLALTLTAVVSSCAKFDSSVRIGGEGKVTFACGESTRSVSDSDTDGIGTVDLLVFRKDDGFLESYSREEGNRVTASVTTGLTYVYYVVANAPENILDRCATEDSFRRTAWALENIGTGVAMIGSGERRVEGDETVAVSLDRIPSKVTLEGITPAFLEHGFKGADVRLERVFLINVNGTCPYYGSASAGSVWYNRLGMESLPAAVSDCLVAESGKTLSGAGKIADVFSFICCPNPVNNGVTSFEVPQWSVRNTRLVIEISIDGVPNYYSVDMPAMSCNTNYIVRDAVLLGPGSADPDIPVARSSLSFSLIVNPWIIDAEKNIVF